MDNHVKKTIKVIAEENLIFGNHGYIPKGTKCTLHIGKRILFNDEYLVELTPGGIQHLWTSGAIKKDSE